MPIVDAHLDLAYNAFRHRNILRPACEQSWAAGEEIPTVGLPDLRAANVQLVCATVFAYPAQNGKAGYTNAQEAYGVARDQFDWYQEHSNSEHFRIVRRAADLPSRADVGTPLPLILLLEGADPIRTPADLEPWFEAGLRIVGLAWQQTRYAGGTFAPGPLTDAATELIPHLDRLGIIHDLSHLADESFWQLLDRTSGPVMASHSNCRAIVPTDRQLSDDMILAIIARDGVIGINFYDKFLLPPEIYGTRRAKLADLIHHVDHICQLAGNAQHVALGTDLDGGVGRDEIPEEIVTAADLPKVADALKDHGYSIADVSGIMSENWMRFFRRTLPDQ
jgi:membrane dipeptidase